MQKYQDSVLSANASGDRPVGGASITVTQFPGGGAATIYSDNGVTPIIQPISTGPDGSFAFYAADGHYNISVSGPGIAARTITDVLLQDSAATIALPTAAATVGSTGPSNVQADLNARPIALADYTTLRAYAGAATAIQVTGYLVSAAPAGTAGTFTRDDTDTTSPDNGGTVFVDALGRRWKRVYSGAVNLLWFGADRLGATDSYPAIVAAVAAAIVGSGAYYYTSPAVYVPLGAYKVSQPVVLSNQVRIFGDSSGMGFVNSPTLNFTTPGGSGFVVQKYQSGHTGAGSIIEGLCLNGTAGTADTYGGHGIYSNSFIWIKGVQSNNFAGDGVHIFGNSGAGFGNANGWRIDGLTTGGCTNGLWVEGADANAGVAIGVNVTGAAAYGIYDNSFLGNTYLGCEVAASGSKSVVNQGGVSYYCVNAATAGSTTPGTDSTVWAQMPANGSFPAWVNGGTYLVGAALAAVNHNSTNVFSGGYTESGQVPSNIVYPSVVIGGNHGAGFTSPASAPHIGGTVNGSIGANQLDTGNLNFGTSHLDTTQTNSSGNGLTFADTSPGGAFVWTFAKTPGAWGYKWANLGVPGYITFLDRTATPTNGYARDISSTASPRASFGSIGIDDFFFGGKAKMLYRSVASAIPTSGSWFQGDLLYNTAPAASGFVGWVCVTSGTMGTLNGGATTGSISSGSNSLTVSSATGLATDQFITIVGVTGTFKLTAISGTTVTLNGTASATVAGAAVAFSAAVFKTYGAISA